MFDSASPKPYSIGSPEMHQRQKFSGRARAEAGSDLVFVPAGLPAGLRGGLKELKN